VSSVLSSSAFEAGSDGIQDMLQQCSSDDAAIELARQQCRLTWRSWHCHQACLSGSLPLVATAWDAAAICEHGNLVQGREAYMHTRSLTPVLT